MSFFSIIIPSYNRLHTLPATIESVLKQNYTDYEVIVADDGSTDGTANWIKEQKDERIKYIWQTNAGVCAARNKGASIAEGEYLIFLDSDDQVTEKWLIDFKQEIDESGVEVVYCNRFIKGKTTDGKGYQGFLAGTFAIKKSLFDQIGGYDEALKYGENGDLKWLIYKTGKKIQFINKANVIYQVETNGGGANRINRINYFYHIEKKHADYFKKHKRQLQNFCQIAGVDCMKLNRRSEGLRLMWRGYWMYPSNLRAFFRAIKYLLF